MSAYIKIPDCNLHSWLTSSSAQNAFRDLLWGLGGAQERYDRQQKNGHSLHGGICRVSLRFDTIQMDMENAQLAFVEPRPILT